MSKQITLIPELNENVAFMMGLAYKQFRTISNQKLTTEFDITLEMLGALRVLDYLGKVPQQTLSTALHRERSVTKRLVDNCIKRGLIEVHKSDENKKARYLALTADGLTTKTNADIMLHASIAEFYSPLSSSECDQLLSICKKLVQEGVCIE
ncbi:winged helix-turn-helix transcriptional regulator [Moritella sp. 5]|uniref:MarR family winged helix-turn-helix transcriptional regulator n=1 Tax=Moritella sp. 5 TaxID=2746231 RepID=UPI001BAA72E0|nr:MarR family winged helix-turn-helix transcriptional regulator [Moritella sp. 5]QUM81392.1 winged helix-turn-helix transcriptional regulator [Moritella sp. 5]